ncbi:MAG: sporulation integral membrane protein YtvI [Candidatus Saccharibacteria bacterium]
MDPELLGSLKNLVRLAVALLALLIVYLLFEFVLPIAGRLLKAAPEMVMPFLLAILFAILIEPLIRLFQKHIKLGRGLSTFVSLLVAVGGLMVIVSLIVGRLISEINVLYGTFSRRYLELGDVIMQGLERAQHYYLNLRLPAEVDRTLEANLESILNAIRTVIATSGNYLVRSLTSLPELFIFLIITVVATYFIANERHGIWIWFIELLPESWAGKTRKVIWDMIEAFLGFIRAYTILVTLTAILTIIGLSIIGVPYALTIGILTGFLDILPVVGPGSLFMPWIAWEFFKGQTAFAIGLVIVYLVITVVRQILEPRIVGKNVGLHPLATLIALYIGLKTAGFAGVILGPVLVIFILACQRAGVFEGISWKRAG